MRTARGRRPVRVATVSHRPGFGTDTPENTAKLLDLAGTQIERAARMGADLIAFPEIYPQLALRHPYHHAEPTNAGTIQQISELARKHRLYIVWPRVECDSARGLRNTAVLLDRDGTVLGRYDKMFPTVTELDQGVIPGDSVPSFETDLGRVGMLICFDLNFPEVRGALARAEPDVTVFSSMYRGGLQAQALAFETGSFVVTAISAELGCIIDRCGRVLKETTYETLGVARINTNSVALHMDFNQDKLDAMLARYEPALTVDFHTREAFMILELEGGTDIRALITEFGLERAHDYFERSRARRAEALIRHQKA